jgi:rhamnosyltransferase
MTSAAEIAQPAEQGNSEVVAYNGSVCAVVVTYFPGSSASLNLSTLRVQAKDVIVVDNGSSGASLDELRAACAAQHVLLIENGENLGVGAALNIGVEAARARGHEWAALFDQDTAVPDGYLEKMLQCALQARSNRTAIVGPCYRNPKTGIVSHSQLTKQDGGPLEVMTSGSLISTLAFEKCGGFNEEFFIDQVDHEYCFRVREFGYRVVLCEHVVLDHWPGSFTIKKLFGGRQFHSFNHAPKRRYYQTRNMLILAWRYRKIYPEWSRGSFKALFCRGPLLVLLAEQERSAKLWYIARGICDGLFKRMGQRVRL